jgi:hypothetical protein
MTLFWAVVTPILVIVAVITIVDVFRRHLGGWPTAGWVILVVVLPFLGPVIYWATRKTSERDAEQAYLADADRRRELANRPYDKTL